MTEILREVGMIARCFESISNIEFKELHLAKGQYLYLVRICENPGIIQERVADMLKVDRTTASRSIKNLVSGGLIEKQNDPDNKKILKLYPTEEGKRIYQFLKREEEYSNAVALQGFSEAELEAALELLHRIRTNIETDWELVKKGGKRDYT
ncbi:MarR family winged helix-turn-helix transcriptional regulator [Paenibacillus sp. GCM10012306]|uniref:MarR family winged helix-turn-helix transcriptional regulator n=1 Tax=Paenibacillus sp. GCM10012306 TaxID=3317342 RepID=UPI00361B6255